MKINFGSSVTNCNVIFDSSENANYGFGNNAFSINGTSWNGSVALPYGANSISCDGSIKLNRNIQIPNSVMDMMRAFNGCFNLNQKIGIPNSVTRMFQAFLYCSNLNQNIQIPNSVTDIREAFNCCSNLNQNIQIPNSVRSMSSTFSYCSNLNQNIQIPNSVTNIYSAFSGCNNMTNITLLPTTMPVANWNSMIRNNASKSINIWTDDATAVNMMNAGFIQGNVKPTMETITNGYYNSQYNVYIYTNRVFN